MSPRHRVICLAPCHQTSQSFALPPATKPVSHLTCPVPLRHRVTTSPHHCITASPRHRVICLAPCHQTSQSFDLPPATKPVSHLTCPVPPRYRVTASPHHCVTASARHRVICLAPCHQTSQSFALPPATKPVSHLTCPVPPRHHVTAPPRHCITAPPRHRVTASPRHLPCPLPPNQSVICLAPCHQTSQSFDLPCTTVSPRHRVTASPRHHATASPRHRTTASPRHRITAPPRHHVTVSFALPPVTKPVSHLHCPLPPNQSVI